MTNADSSYIHLYFFIGSIIGWFIEVIFRRFFSSANPERKWINPGFLAGPCLPLYGTSLCVLYLLASFEKYNTIQTVWLNKAVLFIAMSLCVTVIEYFTGYMCMKFLKVCLWDYTKQWGNINGYICPKFTFFWMILSAIYYFAVHPRILEALDWLSRNLAFSFFVGVCFGVFVLDLTYSTKLISKVRSFAKENEFIVHIEELREHIRKKKEEATEKKRFILSMHSERPISEHLSSYYDNVKKNA